MGPQGMSNDAVNLVAVARLDKPADGHAAMRG